MKDLSIIIPVYNVEAYIHKCLDSIFRQGMNDDIFEIILVNDGTPDKSLEVITDIIEAHQNIHIIEQHNQGISVARNKGLSKAEGKYILFVDSDDLLQDNCLSLLLEKALISSADMVIADYVKMTDNEIEHYIPQEISTDHQMVVMSGKEAFLSFFNPRQCFIWRTLYRKVFIDEFHLEFIPGIFFEDIPFTIECYLHVNKTLLINFPFYIYRQHNESTVSSINPRKLYDINKIIAYLWSLQESETTTLKIKQKLVDTIFETFSLEMWYLAHEKQLFVCRKEIVDNLKMMVPNLSFKYGIKQKAITLIFYYFPYTYLRLRSFWFILNKTFE